MENSYNNKTEISEIFTGGFLYYILKLGLGMLAILFSSAGILIMVGGIYKIISTAPLDKEMIALIVILLIFAFNTSFVSIIFLHMYPQIFVSSDRLLYRHFFYGWNSIQWQDIEEIRAAKTVFVTQGTVVFSPHLPWYYRFFGRSYGRRKGKALFIPNQLITHQEFLALLRQYNVRVRISL